MKHITFRGLLVISIVFFINGCGGGDSSDNSSSSNSKNGDFSLTLDVDEITLFTNWKDASKTDGLSLDIIQNARYGEFTVEDERLSYRKTVETNQSDSGQFEIEMQDGTLVPITVIVNSLYWKEAKCGAHHTIALKSDGTIWSWGYNQNGELGDGTNTNRLSAVQEITKSTEWRTLDAGGWFNVAIKKDNTLWAWGHNDMAQFGDGSDIFTNSSSNTPQKVSSSQKWSELSAGQNHVLALQNDSTLWAWGSNSEGQVGNGDTSMVHTPYKIDGSWLTISAGEDYSMAIKSDNTLWGWGENGFGELGIGSTTSQETPVAVDGRGWSSLATGDYHTLAIKDGKLFGWGMNGFGELTNNGDGTDEIHQPKEIAFEGVKKMCAGANYSLAIKEDGTLWGWGNNQYAQLGIDNWNGTKVPIQEATKSNKWVDVDCGTIHSVAIQGDGTLWIWGSNEYGELGIGTLDSKAVATHILGRNL